MRAGREGFANWGFGKSRSASTAPTLRFTMQSRKCRAPSIVHCERFSSATELLQVLQDQNLNSRAWTPPETEPKPAFITGSSTSSGIESSAYDDIPCSAGHNSCYISPYGAVSPCVQMPKPAGNLRKQRFDEIWYGSKEMQRVRSVCESQLPLCSSCSIRGYCERCPGLAQMEGGDLLGAYERACELA